jgi:hypothetical protein
MVEYYHYIKIKASNSASKAVLFHSAWVALVDKPGKDIGHN